MNTTIPANDILDIKDIQDKKYQEPFVKLKESAYSALETYSNIHRGSGHKSMISTYLYEKARDIVLDYLGLKKSRYTVIFCTRRRAEKLMGVINQENYKISTSGDLGLSLGVWALAVKRSALPGGEPFQSGGGTTRLVASDWIVWAKSPDKYEAGTPSIINVIIFARALQLAGRYGADVFKPDKEIIFTPEQILYNDKLASFYGIELLQELRKTEVGRNIEVPTAGGSQKFINLDNGASTPTFIPIWEAAWKAWRVSEESRVEIIEEVKTICTGYLGARADFYDLLFTSNTTEAINIAAESLGLEPMLDIEPVVINTILEHNSNDLPWRMQPGITLIRVKTDRDGFLDLNMLESLLSEYNQELKHGKKRIKIFTITGASNVLGVFNDLGQISKIVHRYGVRLLVDAAQLVAHREINVEDSGIDYLVLSAHKIYAPFGSGLLLVRKGILAFDASVTDMIKSSGEENISGIAALGKSLQLLKRIGLDTIHREEQQLTKQALLSLSGIEGLRIFGLTDTESARFNSRGGVIAFNFTKIFSFSVARELAERGGIGVRYGCHCAHLLVKWLLNVPPWLEKFQKIMVSVLPGVQLPGVVRISLGIENSETDIDTLVTKLKEISSLKEKTKNKNSGKGQGVGQGLSRKALRLQMVQFISAVTQKVYTDN
jgi:selenocysteine lyase/cysteine desulfurase